MTKVHIHIKGCMKKTYEGELDGKDHSSWSYVKDIREHEGFVTMELGYQIHDKTGSGTVIVEYA
eukprot:CAMPEP_0197447668 /NCGR_PEP_ID=MMETSP1175-20131217/14264_1 /TAXON_ID=1003142 /ORGANISM="Triceratium dubium, Strain CCMP147" /LENGTH=63 /DNA_ID=CAMNT_0042979101 /DNA_START=209 /DNA_END=400 /DNA_ORIENTATION=+